MAKPAFSQKIVRFDKYEADLQTGSLRKRGMKIELRDQSFAVLASLLEHPGELVTRDELRRRLWPESVFVDFENLLNTAVARLRAALHDSAEHPHFIETLPRRGYRFIGSISAPVETPAPEAVRKARMVVLPFLNLNADPAQEYLSDAVTEEFITALSCLSPEHLGVIARTTAMNYKGSRIDVAKIASDLKVEYLVEGSVRRTEDQIRMNVQLIRTSDQMHVWTNRYDVESRELFNAENAAAHAIAAQIGISPRATARRPTEDPVAYNLYIQGRHHFYKATPEGYAKAKQYFEQAIARAPDFALACDSLAEIYWNMGFVGFMPHRQACSAGIYHALRALEIDNNLAETHALLGMYRRGPEYDWAEAQRELDLALQLDPSSPIVRYRYAICRLMPHARTDEAAAELRRALESDPLSPLIRQWLVATLWLGRHFDRAIEEARILLELHPSQYGSHWLAGTSYRRRECSTKRSPRIRGRWSSLADPR